MKYFGIYLSLMLFSSCITIEGNIGEEEEDSNDTDKPRVGRQAPSAKDNFFSKTELSLISSYCDALQEKKELVKRFHLYKTNIYTEHSYRNCQSSRVNTFKLVNKIVPGGDSLMLDSENRNIFPDLITDESEINRELCNVNIGTLSSRVQSYGNFRVYNYFYPGDHELCKDKDEKQICAKIVTAKKNQRDDDFTIIEEEYLKVSIDKNSYGFVVKRKLNSSQYCPDKSFSEKSQMIIGIDSEEIKQ